LTILKIENLLLIGGILSLFQGCGHFKSMTISQMELVGDPSVTIELLMDTLFVDEDSLWLDTVIPARLYNNTENDVIPDVWEEIVHHSTGIIENKFLISMSRWNLMISDEIDDEPIYNSITFYTPSWPDGFWDEVEKSDTLTLEKPSDEGLEKTSIEEVDDSVALGFNHQYLSTKKNEVVQSDLFIFAKDSLEVDIPVAFRFSKNYSSSVIELIGGKRYRLKIVYCPEIENGPIRKNQVDCFISNELIIVVK